MPATPLDLVFIEGFTGETVIGIDRGELHAPQPLVIDVHAGVPHARACDTDRIGDTIDYSRVHARLTRLMVEHRLQLLEDFLVHVRGFPGVWNPCSAHCARYWKATYPAGDYLRLEPSIWRDYEGSLS